jgi:molecular chaperone GrpE
MTNETEKSYGADQVQPGADRSDATAGHEELTPSEWSVEQVEEWKDQAIKAQEHWERLVRVSADFDNYKKRAAREREEATRYANKSLLEKLVPILDNLEAALGAANSVPGGASEALTTGVGMTYNQLRSVLADAGLEEIDAAGKPFDPNWHEAVSQQPSAEVPEGTVLQQLRKGFKLKERLIRPATVVVAKKPGA